MMPMRIRRKGRPIEKLENPTALQCRGRSFPCGHATQFTLASTCDASRRVIVCGLDDMCLCSSWPGQARA
nr:hypothetical protein CIT39_02760 [Bradyrhizobium symbiodeficiens]QDF41958.1 hypothetical protein FJN17_32650 [Bradyrhizobium symbiodeficiens]